MKKYLFIFMLLTWSLTAQENSYKEQYDMIMAKLPNDTNGSEELALKLLEKARATNNEEYVAKAYFLLGAIKYYNSRYYISAQFYTKALETEYAKNNSKFREFCYNNRGANFDILNSLPEALKDYNTSFKLAETRKDSSSMAQTLINIALLDARLKKFLEAEQVNKEVLLYFLAKKDTSNIALCYQNLGLVFQSQKKFDLALENSKKALHYHRAAGYDYGIVQTLFIMGEIYTLQEKIASSDLYFLKALEHLDKTKIEMERMKAFIYVHLAKNNIERNNFDLADSYLKKAYNLLMVTGSSDDLEDYYYVAMAYYAKIADFEGYKSKQKEYILYVERKEEKRSIDRYNELKSFYGYEQREERIKEQQSKISLMRVERIYLILIILIIAVAALIILHYYRKTKRYVKTLYDSNVKNLSLKSDAYASDTTDMHAALYNQILDLMKEEKLYLDPNFSIVNLGRRMGTNSKYISHAINTYGNLNFNSFINTYRIDEAKRIIINNGNAIALKVISAEVGFNNHTTFYRQFKEITGLTPTEFVDISTRNLHGQMVDVA